MKKHIDPDAFISPALAVLEIDIRDEALFRKFVVKNAAKLDELWALFLEEEAYDRLLARTPSLRTLIRHTSLSTRTKNALEKNYMETVGQLAQYSIGEIRRFRGVGEGMLTEITGYMAAIGLPLQRQSAETEEERQRRLKADKEFLDSVAGRWIGNDC